MKPTTETYTGNPCRAEGHTLRYKNGSACVACTTATNKQRQRLTDPVDHARKSREWRRKNPSKTRDIKLKQLYGISHGTYERLLEDQDGVCSICQSVCDMGRRLAVDHDHTTGRVRGLLCARCNRGIGSLRDDPALLDRAAAYLREANCLSDLEGRT
jgi:hypothetical protein